MAKKENEIERNNKHLKRWIVGAMFLGALGTILPQNWNTDYGSYIPGFSGNQKQETVDSNSSKDISSKKDSIDLSDTTSKEDSTKNYQDTLSKKDSSDKDTDKDSAKIQQKGHIIDTSIYSVGKGNPYGDTLILAKDPSTGEVVDTIYNSGNIPRNQKIEKEVIKEDAKGLEKKLDNLSDKVESNSEDIGKLTSMYERLEDRLDDLSEMQNEKYTSIKKEMSEIEEKIEKQISQYKSENDGNVQDKGENGNSNYQNRRQTSGDGMSKREDPGKDFEKEAENSHWVPLVRFYDCANTQVVGGTKNIRGDVRQSMINAPMQVEYKGNAFDYRPNAPSDPLKSINGGSPIEEILDNSQEKSKDGFYQLRIDDVKKEDMCAPSSTGGGEECRFVQYYGKFSSE